MSDELPAYRSWQQVLDDYVDVDGQIDFKGIKSAPQDLERFVSWIARYSPVSSPNMFPTESDRLAYYINSYNALAVYGVIKKNIPVGFTSFSSRSDFFYLAEFIIGGENISLYDYENKIIRKLGEPRIHFALNCMVKGCPRLPRKSFTAQNLNQQLNSATKEFFSSKKHLAVEDANRIVKFSEILSFYTDDFISKDTPTLIDYANLWLEDPIPSDYTVKFFPYDWTINIVQ